MFEKRLKEISSKLGGNKEEYFILTHKKHKREIYFRNTDKAIKFMTPKFNSLRKRVVYILIKFGILQLFLKKIGLSSKLGEIIYVANQIKGFDLERKEVISFPLEEKNNKTFVKLKKIRNEIVKKGFAPKLIEINKKIPYVREELLKEYGGGNEIGVFKRLYSFYKSQGIKEISSKEYVKSLINRMNEKGIRNEYLINVLKKLLKFDKKILITTLHGDFAKENVLINKRGEIVFIDWNPSEGVIVGGLVNFFRGEENLLENKKFVGVLKEVFQKEVQKDIRLYIVLNEITLIIKAEEINKLSMERIKRYSSSLFSSQNQPP